MLFLKNDLGEWVTDPDRLKNLAVNFYSKMFETTHDHSQLGVMLTSSKVIGEEDVTDLGCPVTKDEVKFNLSCMDLIKSPGPDGIQPVFYRRYWSELGDSLTQFCIDCFTHSSIPVEINNSYITLIPKKESLETMSDFRPIGLCNTIYKLVTKVITNRLRPILGKIISPF